MDRRRFTHLACGSVGAAVCSGGQASLLTELRGADSSRKVLGMYVHAGWAYGHPYAARTWTVQDWRHYADGMRRLGYNTFIIWPGTEIMPNPLTASDQEHITTTAQAIRILRREFDLEVYLTISPNVVDYQPIAEEYAFNSRPLFASTTLSDPTDLVALTAMMQRREELLRPLREMTGLVVIDSDLGGYPGYPGSTNEAFANLLHEYRKMLNRLGPGIELVYWMHVGWQAYSDMYQTGIFRWGTPAESQDILSRLKRINLQPFRITIHTMNEPPNGTDLKLAEKFGLASTSLAFNYGAIEREPSFPITNFGDDTAFKAGTFKAPGGVVGNAQTHCLQLPNTFAFAQGALGKTSPDTEDYIRFADQLIQGQGRAIVDGWQSLAGTDSSAMRGAADQLKTIGNHELTPGTLKGLLFGDQQRFLGDLELELRLKASVEDFVAATIQHSEVKAAFQRLIEEADAYQQRTGYQNLWGWPKLDKALRTLNSSKIDAILDEDKFLTPSKIPHPGDPYRNVYSEGYFRLESSIPRLILAMKETLKEMT